ncbi:pectinesterase-like [Telopea speciosissima]|uniref:pectinesterase-like n=1 Tax=Telopea speciosissima TaxID=54955 RepID=UPI001CC5F8EC|nr:pectinesterase-like [Telopea speciosissima]
MNLTNCSNSPYSRKRSPVVPMATRHFSFLYPTLIVVLLGFSFSMSLPHSEPIPPEIVCKSTPYPYLCTSMFLPNKPSNIFDYFQFSILRSVSTARELLYLVDQHLRNKSSLSKMAIRALDDCQLLAELNMDFLLSSFKTVNSTNTLPSFQADDVQSLLSAILTNQETCLEGLKATPLAWNVKSGLYTLLSSGTMVYSVSLALFTHGWVHEKNKAKLRRNLLFSPQYHHLPVTMWSKPNNQAIYNYIGGRKLLQTTMRNIIVRDTVVVRQDGKGNFSSINDAVSAAPNKTSINSGYFVIHVAAGVYGEYVSIDKNKMNIMMIGDGIQAYIKLYSINQSVITGRSGNDGWTTFNSATFAVAGQGFVAVNITFRNTAGAIKGQAVAVRNGADLSTFYNCSFEGYQDTLYTHSLRQFYRECDIYGTVDFIFGNAAVVFQKCNIYGRLPIHGQSITITAQGRSDLNQNTGTCVQECNIKAASELASSNASSTKTYLGRPWRQYSRTIFMQSFLDSFINPAGWTDWGDNTTLSTLYYAELNNTGPGSSTKNRVRWPGYHEINAKEAANFSVSNFIHGDNWLPATRVPNIGGL